MPSEYDRWKYDKQGNKIAFKHKNPRTKKLEWIPLESPSTGDWIVEKATWGLDYPTIEDQRRQAQREAWGMTQEEKEKLGK
jgi:hypothetical protein